MQTTIIHSSINTGSHTVTRYAITSKTFYNSFAISQVLTWASESPWLISHQCLDYVCSLYFINFLIIWGCNLNLKNSQLNSCPEVRTSMPIRWRILDPQSAQNIERLYLWKFLITPASCMLKTFAEQRRQMEHRWIPLFHTFRIETFLLTSLRHEMCKASPQNTLY